MSNDRGRRACKVKKEINRPNRRPNQKEQTPPRKHAAVPAAMGCHSEPPAFPRMNPAPEKLFHQARECRYCSKTPQQRRAQSRSGEHGVTKRCSQWSMFTTPTRTQTDRTSRTDRAQRYPSRVGSGMRLMCQMHCAGFVAGAVRLSDTAGLRCPSARGYQLIIHVSHGS